MKERLRLRATSLGIDLLDVAPAAGFPGVPGWCRSVVVLGMAVLDPALDLELYLEAEGARRWSKWAYERLMAAAARLAEQGTAEGHRTTFLDYDDSLAVLDLKSAAVRAGLGVLGLNRLVLTPRFGPRVRWGAVFTEAELPAGRPRTDYFCVSCSLCIAACPTAALGPNGLDRSRCIAEFAPLGLAGPGQADAAMVALQRKFGTFPTPHTRRQCAACIDACPVGKRLPTRFWGLDPR